MVVMLPWLVLGCQQQPPEPQAEAADPSTSDQAAPESLPVADVAVLQQQIQQAAAADQVLVIDFWATWCQPCVAMFPQLHATLHDMGDAVRPITVTLDDPGEYEKQAIAFLKQHEALEGAYLLAPDAREAVVDELGDQWNMLVVPAILVFDRQGQLAGEFFGGEVDPIVERVRTLTAN